MKKYFIVVVLFLFSSSVRSQNFPTEGDLLKIIGNYCREKEVELKIIAEKKFEFLNSRYTNKQRKECIVICPVEYSGEFTLLTTWLYNQRDMVVFFYKDNNNEWTKDFIYIDENAPYSSGSANIIDINNDKIFELRTDLHSMLRGHAQNWTQIISYLNGEEKILYSNHGFILPEEEVSDLFIGDTTSIIYDIKLKDINKDGIKEIIENKKIGLLTDKREFKAKTIKATATLILKDGEYVNIKEKTKK